MNDYFDIKAIVSGLTILAIAGIFSLIFSWIFFRKKRADRTVKIYRTKPPRTLWRKEKNTTFLLKTRLSNLLPAPLPKIKSVISLVKAQVSNFLHTEQKQIVFTEEFYKQSLENAVKRKELELQEANKKQKPYLQAEITELNNRLTDIPNALKDANQRIASLESMLERESNEAGAEKMAEAQDALEKGDFSKAIEFFTEIKKREELGEHRSARASFALGDIAEQEVRWRDAFKHYARAVQLDPKFETITKAQGLAFDIGNYSESLSFGMDAKKAALKEYGENSEQYANSLNNLGGIYHEQGEYEKAEALFNNALEINRKILSKNHPYNATILNNLAEIYRVQKQYAKAEPLYQEAIRIYKKILGKNNSYTANSINNLALLYDEMGQYEKSEQLNNEALKIRQEVLGENHPDTANSLNNLAGLYVQNGKLKEAYPLYMQALKILETTLGLDHPHTKQTKADYKNLKKHLPNAENDVSQ